MLLAPFIFAAALGQCPEPPSRYGPPPCAAAQVPGCLPGYHRQVDAYGRVTYVCAVPAYRAPTVVAAAPPVAAPPEAAPPYPPTYTAPQYAPPVVERREDRPLLGFVLMPGVAAVDHQDRTQSAGALNLELRGPRGGARLRFGFEASRDTRVADVSVKYDFNERGQVRPFLGLGFGAATLVDIDPGWRPTASVSGGLDLYLSRDIFATLEVKRRAFIHDDPVHGWEPSSFHQTTFFAGIGFYL
jgi:hypothetical protein